MRKPLFVHGCTESFSIGILLRIAGWGKFDSNAAPVREGLSLQITSPNGIFFFLSIFPQFIDATEN